MIITETLVPEARYKEVRFQILAVANMKMTVFCDVAP
jgi:hypothetical protein